jgi:hypothetical protein
MAPHWFNNLCGFLFTTMKAIIKIVSAGKFNEDQERIIKRICIVLAEHDLSVAVVRKVKKVQTIKLKAV